MELTDILSQYLYEVQYEELKTDKAFQAAMAARNQTVEDLESTMSPEQIRLFHRYMEQANYLDNLELQHFFSHCSLLLLPNGK